MRASFQDFIQSGALGSLRLGDTRADVERHLGLPTNWHATTNNPQESDIWKYGDVEFYFNGDILWMIFADDFDIPTGDQTLDLDPWIISGKLTCSEAEKSLNEAGISYRKEPFPYAENGVHLIANSGTTLAFCGEDATHPTLHALKNSGMK